MRRLLLLAAVSLVLGGLLWIAATPRPGGSASGLRVEPPRGVSAPARAEEAPLGGSRPAEVATDARIVARAGAAGALVPMARVRVVDDLGQPVAGLPVGIYSEPSCAWMPMASAPTGEDGELRLELELEVWEQLTARGPFCYLAAAAPVHGRMGQRLERGGDPERLSVLNVGATGGLRLRFEPGGREVGALTVSLSPAPSASDLRDRAWALPPLGFELDGPTLALPHVAVGVELAVSVRDAQGLGLGDFVVAAPALRGETREHVLPLAPTRPRVRARLVDERGGPIAEREVRVEADEPPLHRVVKTDAEGRLELEGWSAPPAGELPVRFVERSFPFDLRAEARVPRGAPGERIELGTLTLERPPVLAAGRVVGPDDRPVPRARVLVMQAEARADGGRRIFDPMGTSDTEGRFELRAWPPDERLALQASGHGDRMSPLVPFQPGATGVELRLVTTGGVYGWVMYEQGLAAEDFVVELVDLAPLDGVAQDPREARVKRDWEDGFSFVGEALPAGAATVRVRLRAEPEPLVVVPAVEVPAGSQSFDKRLQGIDLGGLVRRHALEVVDASGAPVAAGRIRYAPALGVGPEQTRGFEAGRAELVTSAPVLDLFVGAPGFRTRRVEGASGRTRVALEPGLELRVELAGDVALAAGAALELRLEPRGGLVFDWREAASGRFTAEERTLRLRLPEPGEYAVAWRADVDGAAWRADPRATVVLEGAAATSLTLLPPSGALEDLETR